MVREIVTELIDGVVGAAGLRVAPIAARGLASGRVGRVGLLDFGEGHRVLAQTEEPRVVQRECLPLEILRHRHAAGAVRGAVGKRIGAAFEKRLDVVGRALAVVHGHDDGRAAEGAVARGEHLRVARAHAVEARAHPPGVHQRRALQLLADALLSDRRDHHAALDIMLAAGDRHRAAPAVLAGLAGPCLHAAQPQAAAVRLHRHLPGVIDELDAFGRGAVELELPRRNLVRAAPVDDLDVLAPGQTPGHPARIHGHVTAADHHHRFRHLGACARIDPPQEAHTVDDTLVVLARDAHGLSPPGADGEQHGVVPGLELGQAHVTPERRARVHGEPLAFRGEAIEVFLDDAGRQPKRRDAPHHHAAGTLGHLVDVHLEAGDTQIVRRHQPGRSGTDDAHALRARDRYRRRVVVVTDRVHHVAFQIAYLHGPVAVGAPARRFARGVAHAPADGAEGVGGRDRLEGLCELPLPDVGEIGRRIGADGAGHLAGGRHEMEIGRVVGVLRRRLPHEYPVDVIDRHARPTSTRSSGLRARWPGS